MKLLLCVNTKVAVTAFDDVLSDFGLSLSTTHRKCLLNILDWESKGRINIEGTLSLPSCAQSRCSVVSW
jgi:hypothetical protein